MAVIYIGGATGMIVNESFAQVIDRMHNVDDRDPYGFVIFTQPLEGPTLFRTEAIDAIAPGKDENKNIVGALAAVPTTPPEGDTAA